MAPEQTVARAETTRPPLRARRRPALQVTDPVLARALKQILEEGTPTPSSRALVIGDEETPEVIDVLVIPPTPVACARAIREISEGKTASVVTTDALEDVHGALRAAAREVIYLPWRVVALAQQLPPLGERDIRILKGLMVGYTNGRLARAVGVSEATLKRSVALLMTRMGVTDRAGLVVAALGLGLKPNGIEVPRAAVADDACADSTDTSDTIDST